MRRLLGVLLSKGETRLTLLSVVVLYQGGMCRELNLEVPTYAR